MSVQDTVIDFSIGGILNSVSSTNQDGLESAPAVGPILAAEAGGVDVGLGTKEGCGLGGDEGFGPS